jgi:hypothetical protein
VTGCYDWQDPKNLFVHPPEEGVVQVEQLLPGHVREYGPAFPLDHQIPHWGYRRNAAPLIGDLSLVRDEVEFPASVVEASLLDLMAAHVDSLAWR